MTLGPSRYLYFYQCFRCTTWAVTAGDAGRGVRCNGGCGGYKGYKHRVLMTSDPHHEEIWDYATKNGVAHLPLPTDTVPQPCQRCGELVNGQRRYRYGFWVCVPCYHAETAPPLTKEQMAENVRKADAQAKADREYERFGMCGRLNTTGE